MANFKPIVVKTFNFEGGYQNNPSDSANYNSLKQLIGTNRGISAIAYETYLKRPPTVSDIKAITKAIAEKVYKKLFWLPLQGDKIKNDSLAHIMFDAFIVSGYEGTRRIKKALNTYYGKLVTPETKTAINDNDIILINKADPSKLFEIVKAGEIKNRIYLAETNPSKYAKFLNGWLNRLSNIQFSTSAKIAGAGFFFVLISVVVYVVNKKTTN